MPRIALIHGFATGIHFSIFRKTRGANAGFFSFTEDIKNGRAFVFRWDVQKRATLVESLNPLYILKVYNEESARAAHPVWQMKLAEFLEIKKPEIIVCHSLGSRLLLETINAHGLPACVSQVLFLQADIPVSFLLNNETILERVRNSTLQFWNVYCPWDPSLFASFIKNASVRFGQCRVKKAWIRNKFFPLLRLPNVHTSPLHSRQIHTWIVNEK